MISLFTSRERKVILFLSFLLVVGNALRYYRASFRTEEKTTLDLGTLEPADSADVARLLETSRELRERQEKSRNVQFPIDINRADTWELIALPGIGKVLADRIVEHRDKKGPFRSLEDLRGVRGIGRAKLEELESYVIFCGFQSAAPDPPAGE